MPEKFKVPTEMVDLPSQGKVYPEGSELSKGVVEMKYMTAKEEDILTNVNLLKSGTALEKMLESLIVSPIKQEDLLLGDRNALLIAARILAYGGDYSFDYRPDGSEEAETIKYDLSQLENKKIDFDKLTPQNEFEFELPYTKNTVTFKLLTVADDRKIDDEIKGMKKAGIEVGNLSTRLKHQITSVNGEYSTKVVRDFIDGGYLLSKDSYELRKYMASVTPDVDTSITFNTKAGKEVTTELPLNAEFFFPG